MIKNLPSYTDFENLGIQCICKSFEMIFNIGDEYHRISKEEGLSEEITKDDYWKHNEITVRTALIVLYQGIEYLMKSEIARHSPLLLIENNRSEWPTLPNKKDKEYDEMQTISGESLIGVFCAVAYEKIELIEFVEHYEKIRIKRNKLVHSTGLKDLDHVYILEQILFFISVFYNRTKWLELFRNIFTSEPTFGYWDEDIEEAEFYRVLDFVERELGKGKLNKYLNFNLKSRRYLCPDCTYWLNKHDFDGPKPKWSFLKPNDPKSTIVECLICTKKHEIERKNCSNENCKGNVISLDEVCLTCFDSE